MNKQKYYAVRCGNAPGIYTSWEECKKHVHRFHGARFKSFETVEEAQEFITGHEEEKAKKDPILKPRPFLKLDDGYVYTDGACSNNGTSESKAGIGVFFGTNDVRNLSESLPENMRQTNQVAELYAISRALDVTSGNLTIFTDSTYAIKAITNQYNIEFSENKDLIQAIQRKIELGDRIVQFVKVKGHGNDLANNEVDLLAKKGIK